MTAIHPDHTNAHRASLAASFHPRSVPKVDPHAAARKTDPEGRLTENVEGHLPKELAGVTDKRLGIIFAQPDAAKGLAAAKALAKELEADHPDAAASLREGLDDMFTVRRLGVGGTLAKTLTTTNCIESMISIAKRTTGRVTKWKDGSMKKRFIAAGMLEAERSFRRVRGHKDMAKLVEALRRQVTPTVDTSEEYDQAAA